MFLAFTKSIVTLVFRRLRRKKFIFRLFGYILLFTLTLIFLISNSATQIGYDEQDLIRYLYQSNDVMRRCDIFLLDTTTGLSALEDMDPRQVCAIESAVRLHPEHLVCLGVLERDLNRLRDRLSHIQNIEALDNLLIIDMNFYDVLSETPLHIWWKKESIFFNTVWKAVHMKDAAKVAIMFKYGGLFLDLDILVLKPLFNLNKNFVGIQHFSSTDGLSSAVMKFKGPEHPFVAKWMYSIPEFFDEDERDTIGSTLLTEIMIPYCQMDVPEHLKSVTALSNTSCDFSLKIFPQSTFYPIAWPQWKYLFTNLGFNLTLPRVKHSYAVHLWSELSNRLKPTEVEDNSTFMWLAKQKCPGIFQRELLKRQ